MKIKPVFLLIITVICIGTAVALWFAVNHADVDFTETEVVVLSAETRYKKFKGAVTQRYEVHDVKVEYNGEPYDLKNVHNTYSYQVGDTITVYLSNGNLYANLEGVNTSTLVAKVYYVFLFAGFAMIFITASSFSRAKKERD